MLSQLVFTNLSTVSQRNLLREKHQEEKSFIQMNMKKWSRGSPGNHQEYIKKRDRVDQGGRMMTTKKSMTQEDLITVLLCHLIGRITIIFAKKKQIYVKTGAYLT